MRELHIQYLNFLKDHSFKNKRDLARKKAGKNRPTTAPFRRKALKASFFVTPNPLKFVI